MKTIGFSQVVQAVLTVALLATLFGALLTAFFGCAGEPSPYSQGLIDDVEAIVAVAAQDAIENPEVAATIGRDAALGGGTAAVGYGLGVLQQFLLLRRTRRKAALEEVARAEARDAAANA